MHRTPQLRDEVGESENDVFGEVALRLERMPATPHHVRLYGHLDENVCVTQGFDRLRPPAHP